MNVIRLGPATSANATSLTALCAEDALRVVFVQMTEDIPGSYWGSPEAGLIGHTLYVREDTPLHSALHEAAHFFCMDDARRDNLATDAGGDDLEECAVCYLSIVLATRFPGSTRERFLADMDTWGYSFRLGSAARWFHEDAEDARRWLERNAMLDAAGTYHGRRR